MNPLPFDELNIFKTKLSAHYENGVLRSKQEEEDIIDEMLDLFLLAAARGSASANEDLGTDVHIGMKTAVDIIDREVAGKTWRERAREYFDNGGTEADILRIAETESHRDANEAGFVTAEKAGAMKKRWHCMMINSRDTHIYLDGVTAPIDGEFITYNGDKARFPGEFGIAAEDANCRCWVSFEKG